MCPARPAPRSFTPEVSVSESVTPARPGMAGRRSDSWRARWRRRLRARRSQTCIPVAQGRTEASVCDGAHHLSRCTAVVRGPRRGQQLLAVLGRDAAAICLSGALDDASDDRNVIICWRSVQTRKGRGSHSRRRHRHSPPRSALPPRPRPCRTVRAWSSPMT
jgi:hypothetical protein